MVFAFVRSLIGSLGRAIMDFYIANSLVINSAILLYGFIVFLSRRNYYYVCKCVLREAEIFDAEHKKLRKSKMSDADFRKINWDRVKKCVKFPFITKPKKWSLSFALNKQKLISHYSQDSLNLLIGEINGGQE